jgi:hypothetical protein
MLEHILNIFFIVFHTMFILFNLFGWAWKKTRRLHMLALLLTAFSWLVLGIWYGIGYCPCTDWHWQVKLKLGHTDIPYSYMKYLLDTLLGLDLEASLVDKITASGFILTFLISVVLNIRDLHRNRRGHGNNL